MTTAGAPSSATGQGYNNAPSIIVPQAFTPEECDRIIESGLALVSETGVIDDDELRPELRKSDVAFFYPGPDFQWIFDRMIEMIAGINGKVWQYDLTGVEPIQFGRYATEEHYDWHMDMGTDGKFALRKLTVSVQLSAATDYEGGEFEVLYGMPVLNGPTEKGAALVFPSYTMHRVMPVRSGTRYSLVAWIVGERPFR